VTEPTLSFFARLGLAFIAFFRILADGRFAALVDTTRREAETPAAPKPIAPPVVAPPESKVRALDPRAALQVLALFQREGRFIDFLHENVASFSDAEIGAAARVVHAGCHKALHDCFVIAPVRPEAEGARVTLEAGFDPSAHRLTGKVAGAPPHTGTLQHRGYRALEVKLPMLHEDHDARIIHPAELEL
jgi:hypothetical protein